MNVKAVLLILLIPCFVLGIEGDEIIHLIGHRTDRNSVGHGNNLAGYCGEPSLFFYATHRLGNIFAAADGEIMNWFPDHMTLYCASDTVDQQRTVCVLENDVLVSRIRIINKTNRPLIYRLTVTGDCRQSRDWREDPVDGRLTLLQQDTLVLVDKSVFPNHFSSGLYMAIAADQPLKAANTDTAGWYSLDYDISLAPGEEKMVTLACAIDGERKVAQSQLKHTLEMKNPVAKNRQDWIDYYTTEIPVFSCSDEELTELYAFRWYLLSFSTVGGDLGYLTYPVVLEGRQAYQTYCCFSAPFMALDVNWALDPMTGFGQIATMINSAYEDGRFPWYTSPRTNRVRLHHESRTGLSLLPFAAWKHYMIHHDKVMAAQLVPGLIRNMKWWIKDRDPNQDGLFDIQHQLETGMDDLFRWGPDSADMRYDAVDATSYAYANLLATAKLCSVTGDTTHANLFKQYAKKTKQALNTRLWDPQKQAFFDRNQITGELATDYMTITTFYPFFAGAARADKRVVFEKYLLDPEHFNLPHPVPALPKSHDLFNPTAFWQGPSWPAATSHVLDAFARTAKSGNRDWLTLAGRLLILAAKNHINPRADFYERYDPVTGKGLSKFRDYMHSWWVDLFVQHIAGFTPTLPHAFTVDPLPTGLDHFTMQNIPFGDHKIGIQWRQSETKEQGKLEIWVDKKLVKQIHDFIPGQEPVLIDLEP